MKQISIVLAGSLLAVAFIIGTAFGYYLTPEYRAVASDKTVMDLGAPDKLLDLRYLRAMAIHHQGAILMAEQLQKYAGHQELKTLAPIILADEPKNIAVLQNLRLSLFNDRRPLASPTRVNLGTADANFDLRFLNALIAHHEAGVLMAREARAKSTNPAIINDAEGVEKFLTGSLVDLRKMRLDWYNI